jgi:hypothetical protein
LALHALLYCTSDDFPGTGDVSARQDDVILFSFFLLKRM